MTEFIARIVLDTEDWDRDLFGTVDSAVRWHQMPTSFAKPFAVSELGRAGIVGDQYFD